MKGLSMLAMLVATDGESLSTATQMPPTTHSTATGPRSGYEEEGGYCLGWQDRPLAYGGMM